MSLLSCLADRLILCPTTNSIDPCESTRCIIDSSNGIEVEVYSSRVGPARRESETNSSTELVILKFPGTGGRAERASAHPGELMTGVSEYCFNAHIYTLNHRGYGGSSGPASLSNFAASLKSLQKYVDSRHPNSMVLAAGNSLGCLSALYWAANFPTNGLLLRNPPPLVQLIRHRRKYSLMSFGLNWVIASQIPNELRALKNAELANCPALFVSSEKDRIVPVKFQELVFSSFSGPKQRFLIRDADHDHKIQESQKHEYETSIRWLREQMVRGFF